MVLRQKTQEGISRANTGFYNSGIDGGVFPSTGPDTPFKLEAFNYVDLEGNLIFDIDYNDGDGEFYTFKLKSGEELTIPNIPYGYEYEIYEIDSQGNYVEVGDVFNTKWELKSATNTSGTLEESTTSIFTNEIKRSFIKVNKETKGNEEGEFTFRAKVWKDATDYLDLSSQGGTTTSEEGVYEFTISNGENFSIENIPFGYKYEVYEETPEGWDLVSIDGLTPREKAEGTIESEEPYEHTFLNAKRHKLVFEKKVSGNMGDKYKEFEFEVKVYGNKTLFMDEISDYRNSWDSDTLVGGVLFKNPEINQPLFVDYFESKVNQKTYAYGITDNGVKCYEGEDIDNEGSETYLPSIPRHLSINNGDIFHYELSGYGMGGIGYHSGHDEYPTAYLDLENSKHGGAIAIDYLDLSEYGAIESDDFASSIMFTIPEHTVVHLSSQYHEPEHKENIAVKTYTFKLKHGDKIEIEVPYGYTYEIVEKDYSDEGYKQSVDGKSGREVSGELTEDKSHLFENRNQVAVPTEVRLRNMVIPGLSVIALILVYFIIKVKKILQNAK